MSLHRRFPPRAARRGGASSLIMLLLVIAVVTAVIFGVLYFKTIHQPSQEYQRTARESSLKITHLNQPVVNALDKMRFRDEDNDEVADPPADASKLIDPPTLTFSYIPDGKPEEEAKLWRPLVDHLAKATGKKVEYLPLMSVEEELLALGDGRLHVAGLNTGGVAIAVNLCGFVPVVKIPGASGTGAHQMEVIVPADSAIQRVEDLAGHELTLTSADSSSGYRAPLVLLKERGLIAGTDYTMRFSGSHDASIAGIAAKRFEAAAVASDMLARAIAAGAVKPAQYRSVYKSASFPNAGIGYVYNLAPALAAKVRQALLTFDAKGTDLAASYFPSAGGGAADKLGFLPVNYKEDWALLRSTDNGIGYKYTLGQQAPATAAATTRPAGP
jgi:phosphonate transport system substrate-binding protein